MDQKLSDALTSLRVELSGGRKCPTFELATISSALADLLTNPFTESSLRLKIANTAREITREVLNLSECPKVFLTDALSLLSTPERDDLAEKARVSDLRVKFLVESLEGIRDKIQGTGQDWYLIEDQIKFIDKKLEDYKTIS